MSNLLAVQDNNNELGIGSSFISLGTNNDLQFTYDNNTLLQFNTSNNTLNVGTVKQSTWQGTAIGTSYGGTGLNTLGTANQVLAVNTNSGLEWKNSTDGTDYTTNTDISTQAQTAVTIGNINQSFNINCSSNLILNLDSTPTNNQILGYSSDSVKFIDEASNTSNIGTVDQLWMLMNYFYPGYQSLLMELNVRTTSNGVNLLTNFNSFTYNYSLTVLNTNDNSTLNTNIYLEPKVFHNSSITISQDSGSYSSFNINSNVYTLNNTNTGLNTTTFSIKVGENTYVLEIIRKNITTTLTGYRDSAYTNPIDYAFINNTVYVKTEFSELLNGLSESDITITNGTLVSGSLIPNVGIETTIYKYSVDSTQTNGNNLKIKVNSGVVSDTLGNINKDSNELDYTYDNVRPFIQSMNIYTSTTNRDSNTGAIATNTSLSTHNVLYAKVLLSENSNDFSASDITKINCSISSFEPSAPTGIGTNNYTFTITTDLNKTSTIQIQANKFTDAATNQNTNLPANSFTFTHDDTKPSISSLTLSGNGSYKQNDVIIITAVFDEVIKDNTPKISISGSNTLSITSMTKDNNTTYTYSYTVGAGDGSATITISDTEDLADNKMDDNSNTSFTVDNTKPTVDHVTSQDTDNGKYTIGETIVIWVIFTETVTVTGTPQLTLETDTTDVVVNYTTGTGTDTLKFNYTVATGHTSSRLDYKDTTALKLNGGTIKDVAGNNANLTLATPQTAGSLWWNKDFVIYIQSSVLQSVGLNTNINQKYYVISKRPSPSSSKYLHVWDNDLSSHSLRDLFDGIFTNFAVGNLNLGHRYRNKFKLINIYPGGTEIHNNQNCDYIYADIELAYASDNVLTANRRHNDDAKTQLYSRTQKQTKKNKTTENVSVARHMDSLWNMGNKAKSNYSGLTNNTYITNDSATWGSLWTADNASYGFNHNDYDNESKYDNEFRVKLIKIPTENAFYIQNATTTSTSMDGGNSNNATLTNPSESDNNALTDPNYTRFTGGSYLVLHNTFGSWGIPMWNLKQKSSNDSDHGLLSWYNSNVGTYQNLGQSSGKPVPNDENFKWEFEETN